MNLILQDKGIVGNSDAFEDEGGCRMGRIGLLPADARPVTRDLPAQVAAVAGWETALPPREWLGFLKTSGDVERLLDWMRETAHQVDGWVISCDMMGYGGLVPSRVSTLSEETVWRRLTRLKEIKMQDPEKPVYAFSSVMRISNSNINEEEKEYWADYGQKIWAYSFYSHRYEITGDLSDRMRAEAVRRQIPERILHDYLETRLRHFRMNRYLFEMAKQGWIDFLVFSQDDTSEYGLNVREQGQIREWIRTSGMERRVLVYPGADEVACTLTMRMIHRFEGRCPKFFSFYSGERGSLIRTMYEDRPLGETVQEQIVASGGIPVHHPEDAEVILAINTPGKKQGDRALGLYMDQVDTRDRDLPAFVKQIIQYLEKGKRVAVADVAYANGADPVLISWLEEAVDIPSLAGFAAWNTAGNTLGNVVAHAGAVLAPGFHRLRHETLLFLRLSDDYLYQTVVRPEVKAWEEKQRATPEDCQREVNRRMRPLMQELFSRHFAKREGRLRRLKVSSIQLPWRRLFEVCLDVEIETEKVNEKG